MQLDLLPPEQIEELLNTIELHNLIFTATYVGWDTLLPKDKAKLTLLGVTKENLGGQSYVELAFKFGMLSQSAGIKAKEIELKQLKRFVKSGKFIPLNDIETAALQSLQTHMYSDLKGLGNKMMKDFTQTLIEVDKQQRAAYEKIIKKELTQVVLNRESVKEAVSRLGHATGDWSRDFGRIADYILHDAYDRGRAASIKRDSGKDDPEVYKDVYEKACKHCTSLYLTGAVGSKPKIFKLSQLEANGSNIGVLVDSWKPVLGPSHPFCRCTLNEVPDGYDWDEETRSFQPPKEYVRKVKRNSKISVTIGENTTKV